jgi:hypothetical protein
LRASALGALDAQADEVPAGRASSRTARMVPQPVRRIGCCARS